MLLVALATVARVAVSLDESCFIQEHLRKRSIGKNTSDRAKSVHFTCEEADVIPRPGFPRAPGTQPPHPEENWLGKTIDKLYYWYMGPYGASWDNGGRETKLSNDGIWTTWYLAQGSSPLTTTVDQLGELALAREAQFHYHLFDRYPEKTLVGFYNGSKDAPESAWWYRSSDGSWNDLSNPLAGAACTRFSRQADPRVSDWNEDRILEPNPREISRKLLNRSGKMKIAPFLNVLAAAWIQFMVHDWAAHAGVVPENIQDASFGTFDIPLAEDDPLRSQLGRDIFSVPKTMPDPSRRSQGDVDGRTFRNEVTHWWDASQVYGSTEQETRSLRAFELGQMKLGPNGLLPRDSSGKVQVGFNRNLWLGLGVMHTVFVKEHNSIAKMLHENHVDWDDDRLFQTARLINAALMAKIHTVEWTPAVLPNPSLTTAMKLNWDGLLDAGLAGDLSDVESVLPLKDAMRTVKNPLFGGIGGKTQNYGEPFSFSEEFVEVYRLHSILPEKLEFRKVGNRTVQKEVGFTERLLSQNQRELDAELNNWVYSLGVQNARALELFNYPSEPYIESVDLATIDVLRGRERMGMRYNDVRRGIGLEPIKSFEDLFRRSNETELTERQKHILNILQGIYDSVDDLDLMVGTLSEEVRPTGFGFGETLFLVFVSMATRRLQADRFFTEAFDEAHYTLEGMKWLEEGTLKNVLLRHFPQLSKAMEDVGTAFEPWDARSEVSSDEWAGRHPLQTMPANVVRPEVPLHENKCSYLEKGFAFREEDARVARGKTKVFSLRLKEPVNVASVVVRCNPMALPSEIVVKVHSRVLGRRTLAGWSKNECGPNANQYCPLVDTYGAYVRVALHAALLNGSKIRVIVRGQNHVPHAQADVAARDDATVSSMRSDDADLNVYIRGICVEEGPAVLTPSTRLTRRSNASYRVFHGMRPATTSAILEDFASKKKRGHHALIFEKVAGDEVLTFDYAMLEHSLVKSFVPQYDPQIQELRWRNKGVVRYEFAKSREDFRKLWPVQRFYGTVPSTVVNRFQRWAAEHVAKVLPTQHFVSFSGNQDSINMEMGCARFVGETLRLFENNFSRKLQLHPKRCRLDHTGAVAKLISAGPAEVVNMSNPQMKNEVLSFWGQLPGTIKTLITSFADSYIAGQTSNTSLMLRRSMPSFFKCLSARKTTEMLMTKIPRLTFFYPHQTSHGDAVAKVTLVPPFVDTTSKTVGSFNMESNEGLKSCAPSQRGTQYDFVLEEEAEEVAPTAPACDKIIARAMQNPRILCALKPELPTCRQADAA